MGLSDTPMGMGGSGAVVWSRPVAVADMCIKLPLETASGRESHDHIDAQDEHDEEERGCPGLLVEVFVGPDRVLEDRERDRGGWPSGVDIPEIVAQGGEDQRCGLAGHA